MPPNSGHKREDSTPVKRRVSAPVKGTGERRGKRAGASARSRGPKGPKTSVLKSTLLPLLSFWVLATVVLAGLIYWGTGSPSVAQRAVQPPGDSKPEKKERASAVLRHTPTNAPSTAASSAPASIGDSRNTPLQPPAEATRADTRAEVPSDRPHPKPEPERLKLAMTNLSPKAAAPPSPPPSWTPFPPTSPEVARVAIVIDDFGQNMEMANKFLDIPLALTFSVLPHQKYSHEVAALAHSRGREVMLHLPMQPQGYPLKNPGKGALFTSMSSDAMRRSLQSALDVSPHFKGVNNHMGSRFTEDREAMGVFLNEVRQKGLYFLDSSTSPKSVGHSMAQQLHVLTGRRDVFLDHTPTEDFVRSQIDELIRKARIEGSAIAIGHPYEVTLRVLSQRAKRFEEEGVTVVPSGELLR